MVRSDVWTQVWEELEASDLPGDLADIAMERSMADVKHLVEVAGQYQVYVPAGDVGDNVLLRRLARHLSPDLYAYLRREWQRCNLYIPTAGAILRCYRERYPERLVEASPSQLARAWGISVLRAEEMVEALC